MSRAVFQQQYIEKQHTVALNKLVEISNNVILLMLHENRKKYLYLEKKRRGGTV